MGKSTEEIVEALGAAQQPLSLTRYEDAEDDEGKGHLDIAVPAPEEAITDRLALKQVLAELPDRDRELIVWRYLYHRTQQATAEKLGMTQVQVSRRERTILAEMRRKIVG